MERERSEPTEAPTNLSGHRQARGEIPMKKSFHGDLDLEAMEISD
jgi:hypothetical protein